MIAIPARAVPLRRFFEVLEAHGCHISEPKKGVFRIQRDTDDDHFLERWPLEPEQGGYFVYPLKVQRIAERLGIPIDEFYEPVN